MEDFDPVPREDWHFDDVPENEIVACCLWEYARESPTIGLAADMHWSQTRKVWLREKYASNPELKARDDAMASRIEARCQAMKFDYEHFQASFYGTDYPWIKIYDTLCSCVGESVRCWQKLQLEDRLDIAKHVVQSDLLKSLSPAQLGELEQLWNHNKTSLDETTSSSPKDREENEMLARFEESTPVFIPEEESSTPPGKLTTALTIDYTRYTDQEITDAFREWLIAHRPSEWSTPKRVFPLSPGKGRKLTEFRVALDRLGLMRLLHWKSPTELKRDMPEAWARFGNKSDDFRRELREAKVFFHKMFPFLPSDEQLQSEQRLGTWSKEMRRICERVEKEMGIEWGATNQT